LSLSELLFPHQQDGVAVKVGTWQVFCKWKLMILSNL
jgi:hypothetical protein